MSNFLSIVLCEGEEKKGKNKKGKLIEGGKKKENGELQIVKLHFKKPIWTP